MKNYKLSIQYDGSAYAGWQIQQNSNTIQEKIVNAIEIFLKEKVNLIGAGRTDAGVHALGQVANFRTENEINIRKFLYSINSILPKDISILNVEEVPISFHARFDALSRSYIYVITHVKSPFLEKYSYLYPEILKFDTGELNRISKCLLGEHDFTSFSKKNEVQIRKNCIISEIHWLKRKEKTLFYITANRFLHGMVRTIIGTIINTAEQKLDVEYILNLLDNKDRTKAAKSVPAKGLFLYKVRY